MTKPESAPETATVEPAARPPEALASAKPSEAPAPEPRLRPIVLPPDHGAIRVFVPSADEQSPQDSISLTIDGQQHLYWLPHHSRDVALFWELLTAGSSRPLPLSQVDAEGGQIGANIAPVWTLEGDTTYYITQLGTARQTEVESAWVDPVLGRRIPVAAGTRLKFSLLYGLHRCTARVHFRFLTVDGALTGSLLMSLDAPKFGGQTLESYAQLAEDLVTPIDARYVEISFVRSTTNLGDENSYLFFTRPSLRYEGKPAKEFHQRPIADNLQRAMAALLAEGAVEASLPLPRLPSRGATTISVHWGIDQIQAIGSPLTVPEHPSLRGSIVGVAGATVHGSVDKAIHTYSDPTLYVHVDGAFAASARPVATDAGASTFAIDLPAASFDGRVHLFCVQTHYGETIAEAVLVLPFCTTPWDAIQKYAESPLPASLAPLAALRAESLRGHLHLLSQAGPDAAGTLKSELERLYAAHEIVLEGPLARGRPRRSPLEFPQPQKPRVSIVIPAHQDWLVTRHCLASLLLAPNRTSFEVILVDSGPADNIADLLRNVVILRQKIPRGFVRDCISGAARARGEYLAFLRPTTEVCAGWLDELIDPFERFDDVGIAGAKLIERDGRLQSAGGIVRASGATVRRGHHQNAHDPRYNYARQVDHVSSAALLMPAALWKKIGGFSLEFADEGADVDLAFKAMAAGARTFYAPLAVVVHDETARLQGADRLQEAFRRKLREKWAPLLAQFGPDSGDPESTSPGRAAKKALVIDYAVPRPNNDAGSYAAVQEMRVLTALGYEVTLVPESFAYTGADTQRLQRMGVQVMHAPFALSMREVLETRGAEFELVYVTRYYIAQRYFDLVRRHAPQARLAFCNADLHFLREMREAFLVDNPEAYARAENTRRDELAVCEKVDLVLSYSDAELAVLASHGIASNKTALCPWVVEAAADVPPFQSRAGIAFIGGFEHTPNGLAVRHFVKQVLPLIHASHPEITFHIFGSDSEQALADLDQPGLVIEGRVDDTAVVYDRCRVFVAPLLTGAGLKGKVIGAFAHGTPTVLSPIAVEATGAVDGRDCIVAESPAAWAAAIVDLYTNETRWNELSLASRSLARTRYSFEHGTRTMSAALQKLGLDTPSIAEAALKQAR